MDHQGAFRDAIFQAVLKDYAGDQMPDLQDSKNLRPLIGLSTVYILAFAQGGIAYVGFEFRCLWEEEHGVGVMTHAGRVIEVEQADAAFSDWSAERDAAGSAEQKR